MRRLALIMCLGGMASALAADAPKKGSPKPAQLALADLPLPVLKGKENDLLGVRVSGPVVVDLIKPVEEEAGQYLVWVSDETAKAPGMRMRWARDRWVRVVCCLRVPESIALRLRVGDEFQMAGEVEKVEVKRGLDLIARSGVTSRIPAGFSLRPPPPPKKGKVNKDEVVDLYLTNVKTSRW